MEAHRRLAAGLRELGVDTVFGLMGDANMHHLIDFQDMGGRFVAAATEGAAVSMADGYARIGRRLGVASVTHGPGMTNTLTALTEAVRARTPLLVLTGDTPAGTDHLQRFDLRGLTLLAGARYERVERASLVANHLARAARHTILTHQPVVLDLPVPLADGDAPAGPTLTPIREPEPAVPAEGALDRALGMLVSARRPVILAGRGAVDAGRVPEPV